MKTLWKVALICVVFIGSCLADWKMFSDGIDTYIYNDKSGEIYIRHKLGKQNYEDVFVKMPHGTQPSELKGKKEPNQNTQTKVPNNIDQERYKLEALKKSQEALNSALEF